MTAATDARAGPGSRRQRVRLAAGRMSVVVNIRTTIVGAAAVLGCVATTVTALVLGDYPIPLAELPNALLGAEPGFGGIVVREWRLPRAVGAVTFGAALGVSGAIFQSVTRNPLGSPDVIGFNAGAYTGALVAIAWLGGTTAATTSLALGGGLLTALTVYLLSYRRGISGVRFVIVGVAVSAALTAVNTLLVLRMGTYAAIVATAWGQGTLENLRWGRVTPVLGTLALAGVAALALTRPLRQLELGDDAARATGVAAERSRLALVVTGVALTAAVTSVCGPIAFVALAAPQAARLLAATGSPTLGGSAAVGALMLSVSDVVAAHLFPVAIPVGVVTVVLGGAYLAWLVVREARRR